MHQAKGNSSILFQLSLIMGVFMGLGAVLAQAPQVNPFLL